MTGSSTSVASGRLSYNFGLEGPAVTVDTACSSSLVALHLACQALRSGECSLALAGGVTVLWAPVVFSEFARQRGLASDGRCKPFAAAADGTGWGEGAGLLLVERLSDARRNGHEVLAVVRGTAVNQDGASNGLTAPNGPSQERVILRALANAGLSPGDVDAVEAHGTGTSLGDPIEAQALLATYGQGRSNGPLRLGSVKSNIGHTQAAAGVGGVIKMVMALRNGVLPKTLHVDEPTPHVDWEAGEVELLTEAVEWPAGDRPRRAGISSFGVSGTNAHVIVEEAPAPVAAAGAPGELGEGGAVAIEGVAVEDGAAAVERAAAVPWLLSAKSESALRAQAARLGERVAADAGLAAVDVGWSLVSGRAGLGHRAVVVGGGGDGLLAGVGAVAGGVPGVGVVGGVAGGDGRVAFVFPGQGSQWLGMAVGLLDESSVFAGRFGECGVALAPFVDWSLEGVLRGEGGEWLGRVDVVQPVLWAVMVSLAELWRSFGVVPSVVVGHSQGEIAAACVAGGLSLEDGARVVALRSRALVALAGRGGMVSVALGLDGVEGLIEPFGERLSVAAVNGPRSVVVSGEPGALEELLAGCEGDGVRARRVAVDYASHSAQIEAVEGELAEALVGIEPRSGSVPFVSTVTGGLLDMSELDGGYWYRNLRETVRLDRASGVLLEQGLRTVVEVSPHPVLTFAVEESAEAVLEDPGSVAAFGTLKRGEGGLERFLKSAGQAWVRGVAVDWKPAFADTGAKRVPLPTYAFQRQRYWVDPGAGGGAGGDPSALGQAAADHPLLGASIALADGERTLLTGRVSLDSHPWLLDHEVLGSVLMPGAGFVELALRAGRELGCEQVEELTLEAPLVLGDGEAVQLQVTLGAADDDGARAVEIYSRQEGAEADGRWVRHATGTLAPDAEAGGMGVGPATWPPEGAEALPLDGFYDRIADAVGFVYGPAFQGLRAAWRHGDELLAEIELPDAEHADAGRFGIHPALLDAALHTAFGAGMGAARLPFSWRGVRLAAAGATALRVRVALGDGELSIEATDADGLPLLAVESLATRPVDRGQIEAARRGGDDALTALEWVEATAAPVSSGDLAVLGAGALSGAARRYADLDELVGALDAGAEVPAAVVLEASTGAVGADVAAGAREVVLGVLETLRQFVGEARLAEARLTVVTRAGVAAGPGEAPDLRVAPVWGLLRAAQLEHPGRLLAVDVDGGGGDELSAEVLTGLLGLADEDQIAVRAGRVLVPRLRRLGSADASGGGGPWDRDGTVLVSGGTSGLGALVARHLAVEHGVGRLVLASRRGLAAEGAEQLVAELAESGCEVRVEACDVADREQLAALIDAVPDDRPLTAVVHAAGAVDDGTVESLTAEQFDAAMAPKVDGALHLHELTADLDLAQFVLFSSAASALGNAGQGNYAAANAFMDALAAKRQVEGLPATSIAWGLWRRESELTGGIGDADLARIARLGLVPIETGQGLELFDRACALAPPLAVALPFDPQALRPLAREGILPPLLRGLVPAQARRAASATGSLARRLADVPASEREEVVLQLVREQVAAVIGQSSAAAVGSETTFKDLGFDSLASVELRNRLAQATGLRLPATLVFDHPTPATVARHLLAKADGGAAAARPARAAAARDDDEPIAIVGDELPLPGGVASPRRPLGAGRRRPRRDLAIPGRPRLGPRPPARPRSPTRPAPATRDQGGFLADAAEFDAAFFGISPREALAMDPQQRLLLEAAWEAFERAGIDPARAARQRHRRVRRRDAAGLRRRDRCRAAPSWRAT